MGIGLQILAQEIGYETRSYSGRGMFGDACLGIELNQETSLSKFYGELIYHIYNNSEDISPDDIREITSAIERAKTDSMGLGTILYFPYTEFDDTI